MKLSIIIVNYNVKYFLEHCLHATTLAISGIQAEVIVVDNNSSDGSMAYLQPKFPTVIFKENKENTGFAKANNQALNIVKGEYVLYLNPDTLVPEDALKDCIHFLDENKDAAAIGVHMLSGSGDFLPESKRSFPSAITSFYKLFLIEKIFPRSKTFGKYGLGFLDKNKIHSVAVLAGAFIMARTSLLQQIGGFDERYFMYGEDIDLSYTLQQCGNKNYYLGNISIVHFKGESTKKDKSKHVKNFYGAMQLFVEKYYKGASAAAYRVLLQTAITIRSAFAQEFFTKNTKQPLRLQRIFLVGEQLVSEQAKKIFENKFPSAEYVFIKELNEDLVNNLSNAAIVFCIGKNLSYKTAINFLQQRAPLQKVFWFYQHAGAVIGSSYKNSPGDVIVA